MASLDVNADILSEILSRTDLNTMKKCRILSKECNTLTYDSGFMESHKERTKTICGYLIQSLRWSKFYSAFLDINNPSEDDLKLSFNFLPARHVGDLSPRSVWILATVDMGLVFCTRNEYPEDQHFICKPTSRQWELIPSPNAKYFGPKIAMIVLRSNPLWFKIVRLSDNVCVRFCDYKSCHCEIFDSSVWAWKQSNDLTLSYYEYFTSDNGITASGRLHWVTRIGNKRKVLSFDPYKESWEWTSVPASCNDDNRLIHLGNYEGKLAILSSNLQGIQSVEVWIMKGRHGEKYWDKKYTIDLEGLKNEIGYSRSISLYNTDTLLMLDDFRATFYNFKNHQHHQLSLDYRCYGRQEVYFVQTDNEPIRLKQEDDIAYEEASVVGKNYSETEPVRKTQSSLNQ